MGEETGRKRTAKIGLIQLNARYGPDVTVEQCLEELLDLAERCLKDGADLVFMPEAYQYRQARKTIPRDRLVGMYAARYKQACSELAVHYRAYVVPWDYETDEEGHVYNTSYILDRSGVEIGRYRKVHLTHGETKVLAAGTDFPVFDLDFGKVGIMICFDNYYAESARILALHGAELILYPLFGDKLKTEWEIKVKARAIDNAVYVAPCHIHSAVREEHFTFTGIVSPKGEILCRVDEEGSHRVCEIELENGPVEETTVVTHDARETKRYLLKHRNAEAYAPLMKRYEPQ